MEALLTFENLLKLIGALAVGGIWAYRLLSKQSAELKSQREGEIAFYARLAYKVVAEFAIRSENKVDDKVAMGLDVLAKAFESAGKKPLTDQEKKLAELQFTALHGDEKLAEKLSELSAPIIGSPVIASPS